MTTMCHSCGLECSNPCSDEKIAKSSTPNGHHQECNCKSFPVKFGEESSFVNGFSPYSTPLTPSPSTHRNCVSSCGAIPVDMNIQISGEGEDALDTGQMHKNQRLAEHMEEHGNGSLYKDIDIHSCDSMTNLDGLKLSMATEEKYTSSSAVFENIEICNSEKAGSDNSGPEDFHSTRAGDDSDGAESRIENNNPSFLPIIETDPSLWEPPEPEDMEDEIDSVANDDEDDDYIDGRKWGKPTSLSSLNERGNSHSYKEERQNAMMGTMNGQFKVLVGRFLSSEGLASLELQGGEDWRDIVASLSWEAALLIKPDVGEGRGMDPGSYVKVKCVASGVRSQSEVIKGLVFKKNTAHKHMPTKFKSPRLLLLRGVLGTSAAVLSSFDSMGQEKDFLKSVIEVIDTCHPNVVLVEKTVSRDIQESLVSKGITLVFDMKLPRLERIARCTGSQIVSCADLLLKPKLKHCDFFHVEKFVEEHNTSGEGGKRPCKTLIFLEGCPKPLGCTILLRGAHCDELKKVKRVLQYTVFAAYHLIMETSFFADQRAFFSDVQADQMLPSCDDASISNLSLPDDSATELSSAKPLADTELKASSSHIDGGDLSDPSAQPLLSGHLLSSVSSSLKSFLGDRFPSINSHSISSYFSFEEKEIDSRIINSPIKTDIHDSEENPKHIEGKPQHISGNSEVTEKASHTAEIVENGGVGIGNKVQVVNKNDIESVLDPQSILILLATQCLTKGVVCEPSHLTRIKYYGNFDLSLGRYLQDILLNKKHSCNSCGEPPEAHVYSYTHQNGRLDVLVKQLPLKSPLPGEAEGKIWMWTRCLKCVHEKGIPRSTRRVVMSTAARGLSFGKFLELSFSSNSAATRLSKCGHLLHRDCLRFFGLGSKVAMFRYSSVEIYAACKPPSVLEFYNPIGQELVNREAREVLARVNGFFSEVWDVLQELKLNSSSFCKNRVKVHCSLMGIHEVEEMLLLEKADFEVSLQKASNHFGETSKTKDEVLNLNWLKRELLLEVFVWDHRLDYLISCARDSGDATDIAVPEPQLKDVNLFTTCDEINVTENGGNISEIIIPISANESFSSCGSQYALNMETEMDSKAAEAAILVNNKVHGSMEADIADMECSKGDLRTGSMTDKHTCTMDQDHFARREEFDSIVDHTQVDHSIPVISVPVDDGDRASDVGHKVDTVTSDFDMSSEAMLSKNHLGGSRGSEDTKNEDLEGWIWTPFSELRRAYRKDLHGGYLQKYGHIYSYKPSHISLKHQLISQEIDSLHFTIGLGGNVMSVSEHEISSIIAYALALSEEQSGLLGKSDLRGQGESDKAIDKSYSFLTSEGSVASSYWSSIGSVDSEGMPSLQYASSLTSDELSTLFSDGPLFADRLVSLVTPESVHPEIPVGISKVAGKSKYSVVCVYAKEFYDLRRRCCPSEMAYISSLSHCKKWDAQGGKSKSIFAKSLDDRFIIKQIKKTEFDSFLKFAPDYFKHVTMSLDSGSQTCLAKILGIYQIRQNKGGKEVKVDLMVMENLLYGRNIACIYDLKGAVFSRYVPGKNDPDKVLLDENFIEDMRLSPIYIGGRSKLLLQRAVWNDTAFLTSINVMDYSLLVGVDKERHELVFGIIDYLRQYTWDKQLETWVKSSLVVPKNELPTVISPREYKKRFRKFMAKHFLTVPDTWSSEPCCAPFKVNGDSDSESSNIHTLRQSELLNSS